MFFNPFLRIITVNHNDDTYAVEAILLVPTPCYIASGTSLGPPPGVVVIPEAEAIRLHIVPLPGPCIQTPTLLRFVRPGLPLSSGKTSLIAFAMLRDPLTGKEQIVGRNAIALPQSKDFVDAASTSHLHEPQAGVWLAPGEVSGMLDRMPGGKPTVYLQAGMWTPTPGYEFTLTHVNSFGETGRTMLWQMTATPPSDNVPQVVTHTTVTGSVKIEPKEKFDTAFVAYGYGQEFGPIVTVS